MSLSFLAFGNVSITPDLNVANSIRLKEMLEATHIHFPSKNGMTFYLELGSLVSRGATEAVFLHIQT